VTPERSYEPDRCKPQFEDRFTQNGLLIPQTIYDNCACSTRADPSWCASSHRIRTWSPITNGGRLLVKMELSKS